MSAPQFDLTTATVFVAVATLVVAFATLLNLREMKRQYGLLFSQTLISRTQQEPFLVVRYFKFQGNKLMIDVENLGLGLARQLGVDSSFFPARPIYYADAKSENGQMLTEDEARERSSKGLPLFARFSVMIKELSWEEWKVVLPKDYVTYLYNERVENAVLLPNERCNFEISPLFEIKNKRSESWQTFDFSELREFLRLNDVRYAGVEFSVICKDSLDKVIHGYTFRRFTADLEEMTTLEEAHLKGHTFGHAVDERELTKDLGGWDGESYRRARRPRNVPGAEDKWT